MQDRRNEIIEGLRNLPEHIRQVLKMDQQIHELAQELYQQKSLLVMGRGFNFATCLEGALVSSGNTWFYGSSSAQ